MLRPLYTADLGPPRVVRVTIPHNVYIGRGSVYGNPFVIGKDGTREEVIAKYAEWIKTQPEILAAIPRLRNKVLGCFCSPLRCHGDVLLKMANV